MFNLNKPNKFHDCSQYCAFWNYYLFQLNWKHILSNIIKKRLYNRGRNISVFCVIQQMSLKPPFPYMQLKWLTLFLIQLSQPIMKKGRNFSQSWNPYTPYCFSSVKSLLLLLLQSYIFTQLNELSFNILSFVVLQSKERC